MPEKKVSKYRVKMTDKWCQARDNNRPERQIDYRDTLRTGLVFRVGPKGCVWYYLRRVDGTLYRIRLGKWDTMKLSNARDEVVDLEAAIASGKHPAIEQKRKQAEKRDKRQAQLALLTSNLIDAWTQMHFPTLSARTQRDYKKPLTEFQEAFGDRVVTDIKRGEIIRHLDRVKARSHAQANRAAVVIRQLFAYAADRHDLKYNPASNLKAPAKATRRKRTLDRNEIRVLWRSCELAGYPYGHCLRFALCTGQRIGEIGGMRWADIDGRYWSNTETKTGQRIDIYLADYALAIVEDCPQAGEYVFTASGRGGIRSDTWSAALARYIRPRIELAATELQVDPIVEHWTAHDLRRTVRTGLTGWAGVSPDTAERVLNHSISGLRANYDFADYKPHVADALQRWDAELGRIFAGKDAEVVPIRRAK